uniref:Uncharacterized protein n=1 Tax=Anguilla anguilla TaxID=7936 RepID=A0A0E9PYA2_ANGAN
MQKGNALQKRNKWQDICTQ